MVFWDFFLCTCRYFWASLESCGFTSCITLRAVFINTVNYQSIASQCLWIQTHTLPTPAWATQLSLNKVIIIRARQGSLLLITSIPALFFVALRVTSPTTISRRFHTVAAIAAIQQCRCRAGLLDNEYCQDENVPPGGRRIHAGHLGHLR